MGQGSIDPDPVSDREQAETQGLPGMQETQSIPRADDKLFFAAPDRPGTLVQIHDTLELVARALQDVQMTGALLQVGAARRCVLEAQGHIVRQLGELVVQGKM